jgi:flagellar basal body-associated protein FliL
MPDEDVMDTPEPQKPASTPLISAKGWGIVLSLVVLWSVFLIVVIAYFSRADNTQGKPKEAKTAVLLDVGSLNKYTIPLPNLTYSIMTVGGATMPTLSMSLEIVLGYTPEEMDNPDQRPDDMDMGAFKEAVKALTPDIFDKLQSIVDSMTYQEIQKPVGKERIKREIMDYINDRLDGIDFSQRVKKEHNKRRIVNVDDIKITQYLIS